MKDDNARLLREINEGCKTAMDSFDQVKEFVELEPLRQLIEEYDKKHEEIGLLCKRLLKDEGEEEKGAGGPWPRP